MFMRKWAEHVRRVAGMFLFIGISVQIVLGIFWMCANLSGFQEFGDSYEYMAASRNFLCDEYIGILYPVLIAGARGVEGLLSIPLSAVLYVVQIAGGFFAGFYLLGVLLPWGRLWRIWGSLGLLTIPMVMQCHMAVLPVSLVISCMLVMLGLAADTLKSGDGIRAISYVRMVPFWLAAGLLMPEYELLAGVPVLVILAFSLIGMIHKKQKAWKSFWYGFAVTLAGAGMVLAMGSLTRTPGSLGRMEKSLSAAAVSRFVWPWFLEHLSTWPGEIQEVMNMDDAIQISWYADHVTDMFGPLVEKAYGSTEAKRLYREMAFSSFRMHTKDILREVSFDATSYLFAPFRLGQKLNGYGNESYSGRNYEIMKEHTPALTGWYMGYGSWWFLTGILAAAAAGLCMLGAGKWRPGRFLVLFGTFVSVLTAYYVLRGAGMMDYKHAGVITTGWYLLMMAVMETSTNKSLEEESV